MVAQKARPRQSVAPERVVSKTYTWSPHSRQARVLRSKKRFLVIAAGRRGGKTEVASIKALMWSKGSSLYEPVWWIANTYYNCEAGLLTCLKLYPREWVTDYSLVHGNMHITLAWGGVIQFKSAERPGSLRGRKVRAAICEEVGEWKRTAWEEDVRPTLTDNEAPAIFIGTPKGMNWFYEMFQRGLRAAEWPEYESFHWTSYENPHLPKGDLDEARRSLPDRAFRQEYMAEFLPDSGGVFPNPRACVKGTLEEPAKGVRYAAGWDVAKHHDWSVLTIDRAQDRHTVHWQRFQKMPYQAQAVLVARECVRYKADLLLDASGVGDPVFEMAVSAMARAAAEAGLAPHEAPRVWPFKFTHGSKMNLINSMALHIGQGSTSWPDLPVLTNEAEIFEYKENGSTGAPEGYHDDAVISKALALWLADRGSVAPDSPLDLAEYFG